LLIRISLALPPFGLVFRDLIATGPWRGLCIDFGRHTTLSPTCFYRLLLDTLAMDFSYYHTPLLLGIDAVPNFHYDGSPLRLFGYSTAVNESRCTCPTFEPRRRAKKGGYLDVYPGRWFVLQSCCPDRPFHGAFLFVRIYWLFPLRYDTSPVGLNGLSMFPIER